jgi:hypothetical protein
MPPRFLQLVTSPEAIRVHNVCTGSAETHPELGRLSFKHGPEETVNVVADYLEAPTRRDCAPAFRSETGPVPPDTRRG